MSTNPNQHTRMSTKGTPPPKGNDVKFKSHISDSDYNRRCKEVVTLYRDLRELGAHMYFSDIPRICVIGSQSAGKSSLVEAVSGINVPRDSGTCTRCPMECTMTQASEWSCTITLRLEYDSDEEAYTSQKTESFGQALHNKSEVEIWLRRAQAAILCPHISSREFLGKSKEELEHLRKTDKRMKEFSKNTIHVDVRDPDVTSLSFVDLPGLIQNSETPELIDLVKDLVVTNIKRKNTLILIAIPMSDDIENQQAVRLAKEADPTGARTIGVLTKPDTVLSTSIGQLQKWRDVLEGKANVLRHGYYCVRLPDEAERLKQLSRADAEKLAEDFFRGRSPWNEMKNRGRFGVPNLVRDASALLVHYIEKNIPILRRQVDSLLDHCSEGLGALPPPLQSEPSAEMCFRINEFTKAYSNVVNATDDKNLARKARERYQRFKLDIQKTTPDFRPFVNHQEYTRPPMPVGEEPSNAFARPMDLIYVREIALKSIGWKLPGHVPFDATSTLVQQITRQWQTPSLACFNEIYAMTFRTLDQLIHKHFGQFPNAENHIRSLVHDELEKGRESTQSAVETLLQYESQPLFTQNTHYLASEETKWHDHFNDVHSHAILYKRSTDGGRRKGFTSPQAVAKDAEPVRSEYAEELAVMARVQAYFCVAYKRIIDYIPLTIEHSLNRTLNSALQKKLLAKLTCDPDFPGKMAELLTEKADVAGERRVLTEQRDRLLQIRTRLPDIASDDIEVMDDA